MASLNTVGHAQPQCNTQVRPFAKIYWDTNERPDLGGNDKAVLAAIQRSARGRDHGTPTDEQLARWANVSIPTVQRGLRHLIAAGLITRETARGRRAFRILFLHMEPTTPILKIAQDNSSEVPNSLDVATHGATLKGDQIDHSPKRDELENSLSLLPRLTAVDSVANAVSPRACAPEHAHADAPAPTREVDMHARKPDEPKPVAKTLEDMAADPTYPPAFRRLLRRDLDRGAPPTRPPGEVGGLDREREKLKSLEKTGEGEEMRREDEEELDL